MKLSEMQTRQRIMDSLFSGPTDGDLAQLNIFLDAFDIYRQRNNERGDVVWQRVGLRGTCVQLLIKAERAFFEVMRGRTPNKDHFLDAINYAAFAIRQKNDLNGYWTWEDK